MLTKKFFFCAISLFVLLGISFSAQAIEYGSLGGKPAYPKQGVPHGETWFVYNLNPGESFEDGIEISNLYSESLEALIYAADTTHSSGGGFALEQFSEPKDEVGSWVRFYPNDAPEPFDKMLEQKRGGVSELCRISRKDANEKLDKREVSDEEWDKLQSWCEGEDHIQRKMEAKERIVIPFIIKIPDSADVGEHTGGILIQKVNPESSESVSGSAIKLTTRVGVRIYETVPGEVVKKLSLEDFKIIKNFSEFAFKDFGDSKKPQEYLIQSRIISEGNASTEFTDIIHVRDLLFKKRSEDVSRKFQILKKDKFISNYSWKNPRFGRFSFQSETRYVDKSGQEQVIFSPEIKVLIMPWREIATTLLFFLVIFAAYAAWKWRSKKKYGGIGWEGYIVAEDETMINLAQKFQIDWKILAKTNKIEAPYILETGQAIKVPPGFGNAVGEKNEDAVEAENSQTPEQKAKPALSRLSPLLKYWLYVVLAIIIAVLSVKIFFLFKERTELKTELKNIRTALEAEKKSQAAEAKPDPEAAKSDSSQKTESAEEPIDSAKINVTVLNGGAAPGSAGKIKEFLADKGYGKAEAGNVDNGSYDGIAVYYKENFKKAAQDLAKILEEKYPDVSVKEASSSEEQQGGLVVILGE